ncbi:carbohydrate ABC transporter permease [Nonomuraea sp. NPDC049480]|uniref:carbohydrate ABC transporter permease n=1 Tax=Nonomuraea sp. NPDC049480 TaxID=3364353 RepID=UPI0037A9EE4F
MMKRRPLTHAGLIMAAGVMLYPLLWMVVSSLKPDNEIFTDTTPWPANPTLEHYASGWTATGTSFTVFFRNSLIVTSGAVIGNVLACSLAAYAFARLEFPLKKVWFTIMLGTIMLPFHATLIPQYVLFFDLGWINTYLPLLVPKFLAVDAFFIFLMVQFIRGIPRSLDEAARLDGAGPVAVYVRIVLPLMRPALITTAIFTFIWTYDDFFSQLVYLSDNNLYTVPLGLNMFIDKTGSSSWGDMFAMSVLALVPTTLFFLFFQKRLVEGLATSGLK